MASEHPSTLYEHMFYSTTKRRRRLTDAVDLLIDFATLGEYGLEPLGERRRAARPAAARAAPLPAPACGGGKPIAPSFCARKGPRTAEGPLLLRRRGNAKGRPKAAFREEPAATYSP